MTNVKNFTIRNQNEAGVWETLYPKTVAAQVVTDASKQFVTDAQIAEWNAKATTAVATTTTDGLMSAADKVAIDALSGNLDGIQQQLEQYTDGKIAELVDSAPEALNTLKELAEAIQEHEDEYQALLTVVGQKATTEALHNGLALKADQTAVNAALALKADKTHVDAELATKAVQAEMIAALELKANKTQVASDLAVKADKTEVQAGLAVKADQTAVDAALALKADQTQVTADIATAIETVTVTTVGTTAPATAKAGDFWYEITE